MSDKKLPKNKLKRAWLITKLIARRPKLIRVLIKRQVKAVKLYYNQHRISARIVSIFLAGIMLFTASYEIIQWKLDSIRYQLSPKAEYLLKPKSETLAKYLFFDAKNQSFAYNLDYNPYSESSGLVGGPKYSANFYTNKQKDIEIRDSVNNVNFKIKPTFNVKTPIQDKNRLVYPLVGKKVAMVYTLGVSRAKEDIIVEDFQGDNLDFTYRLELENGTEARLEKNGAIGVYGVRKELLGKVNIGSDKDRRLLELARKNGQKNNLLFTIPTPFILNHNKKLSEAKAWYSLEGDILTIHTKDLKKATYPISIDPSIYIETAQKLMLGNNETNIDFDIDDELIQKSQTTGARIDSWTGTDDLSYNLWDNGTVVAGGYIYSIGGQELNKIRYSTQGASSFKVPSGVTSITVKMWGAGGAGGGGGSTNTGGDGGGGGFVQATLSTTPGETLTTYVGGTGGGGSYSGNSGRGGGGGGHTSLYRSTTALAIAAGGAGGGGGRTNTSGGAGGAGGGTSGIAGSSAGVGGGGGAGTQSSGGTGGSSSSGNTGANGASLVGGAGADGRSSNGADGSAANGGLASGGAGGSNNVNQTRSGGGGGGSGYYGGGGGGSSNNTNGNAAGGGGGGSSYTIASATSVTNTAGSGTSPGNSGDSDRNGAGEGGSGGPRTVAGSSGSNGMIVITFGFSGGSAGTTGRVQWAKFNSTTRNIEMPNPGNGVCQGWCTDSVYDLPSGRRGAAIVTYNGYIYVMGGLDDSTPTPGRTSTVYIAKLGANGEPQLWHPTDTNKNNWNYWYEDTGLSSGTAKSYMAAYAYNNRIYLLGGETNSSPNGITTVEMADILPNGKLGAWTTTGMQALPSGAGNHMHTVHIYNDYMYVIGGFEGARTSSSNLRNTVYYSKLNSDGTMNAWQATGPFNGARATFGGSNSTVFGAYIYLTGGCTAVNASGYCTSMANDTQLASINADGTLSEWGVISGLSTPRIGFNIISWQSGLYRLGGCSSQNSGSGACDDALNSVDYGVINPAGEVSTVSISEPSGTSPCSGSDPYNCNMPPTGDNAGQGGQMLNMSTILNGYLYVIGGCVNYGCTDASGNTSYVSIDSSGRLKTPDICSGTLYGSWCVDSTNRLNGTTGIAAAGVAVFNNRIYIVGGLNTSGISSNIYYNSTNKDGSLAGAWTQVTMSSAGITTPVAYTYAYARANPAAASTNPGNLYVFGGCYASTGGAGCTSGSYTQNVWKCNITSAGSVSGCSTSGQLRIDSSPGYGSSSDGLGIHSGTVYANYIYLIGGYSQSESDKDDVLYAKFDDNNNVVAVSGSDWIESPNKLSIGRRRGFAFGYNGHIYAVGGYDASGGGIIPFIEWAKMDVSNGGIDPFITSSITINQRWGLNMAVSNSYAYVLGGCDVGAAPSSCSSFESRVQTFQLYNNNSGAVNDFTPQSDQTFSTNTDRWGSSSAVHNGYLYVAGGCISATDCTDATNSVQYAPISASDGSIGTWAAGGSLPADRAWGSLEVAGGTLYYMGGVNDAGTNQATVYYTTSISSGNPTFGTASNGLPSARSRFGSAAWNNRLYVVGGSGSGGTCSGANVCDTVFISPQQNSGGNITSAWSTSGNTFNFDRTGAAVTAYANNLYLFGGYDGTNYLSDVQFTQINSDGTIDTWSYTTSLPSPLRDAQAVSANGYIYLVGGRTGSTSCTPKTLITPISANTTIASGNNPTGVGEWYETNVRYGGGRYGAAVAYDGGKIYTMGGGCTSPIGPNYTTGTISQTGKVVTGSGTAWTDNHIGGTITYQDSSTATITGVISGTSLTVNVSKSVSAGTTYSISTNRHYYSTVKSQPQVAAYSRMIDTDTDVFPNGWLMNGLDNFIGARWQMKYRSMHDLDDLVAPNEDCGTSASMPTMTTWGQETNFGDVTLGRVEPYIPKNGSGGNINCARYFYFHVNIDASKTFGYPEDVNRGPTLSDLSLFFTSDPSKRMRHGKTFTGGLQQPLDTPCRYSAEQPNCPNY